MTFSGIYAYAKKIKKMLDKMRGVCFISNAARRGPGRAAQVKKPSQEGEGFGERGRWEDLSLYTYIVSSLGYRVKRFFKFFFPHSL